MRGKNGQGRQEWAHRLRAIGYKPRITQGRKDNAKKATRTSTRPKPNSPSTCAKCTCVTPEFGKKKQQQQAKTTQEKRTTLIHCNPQPRSGASQRNRTPRHEKTTKHQCKNHSKKKQSKNASTVFALKSAKTHRKQHGKRQTTGKNLPPRKSQAN